MYGSSNNARVKVNSISILIYIVFHKTSLAPNKQYVIINAFINRKMLAIVPQLIGAIGARAAINAHKELR